MNNKEIVLKFYEEVFIGGDLTHIDEFMRDDYRQHSPEVADGKAGFVNFAKGFLAQKPRIEIVKVVAEDDMVVVFFKCKIGEHTHKVFDMYRLKDGKLAEHWDSIMGNVDEIPCASGNGHF